MEPESMLYGYDVNGAPHTAETATMAQEQHDKSPTGHENCCPVCAQRLKELHAFVLEFGQQMEALGNNPMVKTLMGGKLPKLGGRNGKDKR